MQRVPEVNMHLQESMMHHCMPSHEFAAEKVKPRSMRQVSEQRSSIDISVAAFLNFNQAFGEISLDSLRYTQFNNN